MFDRQKSDALFTDTLDLLDMLNTRNGCFEYADYVALHNNITALYDSFMDVDEQLDEFAKAEEEGQLMKLPCKVGDTVWKIKTVFSYFSKPMEDRVDKIIISKNETLVCCTSGTKFSIDSIGKIVFLSREFAEKALEGIEE